MCLILDWSSWNLWLCQIIFIHVCTCITCTTRWVWQQKSWKITRPCCLIRGVSILVYTPMTSTCVSWEWQGWHYKKYTVFSCSVFNTLFASIETCAHFEDVSLGQWTQRILKGNYDCNNLFFTNLHEPEAYAAYRQQRQLSRSTQQQCCALCIAE